MKRSDMRISQAWRTLGSAALAAAAVATIGFTTVTPAKAEVGFGFSVGGPAYYGYYPYPAYGYYRPYYGYSPYYGYPAYSYPAYSYGYPYAYGSPSIGFSYSNR